MDRHTSGKVIKHFFSSSLTLWKCMQGCLFLERFSKPSLLFVILPQKMSILTVYYCPYKQIIEQFGKKFPVTNTLAYISAASMTNKKKFYNFDTWYDSFPDSFPAEASCCCCCCCCCEAVVPFSFLGEDMAKKTRRLVL